MYSPSRFHRVRTIMKTGFSNWDSRKIFPVYDQHTLLRITNMPFRALSQVAFVTWSKEADGVGQYPTETARTGAVRRYRRKAGARVYASVQFSSALVLWMLRLAQCGTTIRAKSNQSCQALMLREQFHGAAASAGANSRDEPRTGLAMNSAGSAVPCHRHGRGWHSNCTLLRAAPRRTLRSVSSNDRSVESDALAQAHR